MAQTNATKAANAVAKRLLKGKILQVFLNII